MSETMNILNELKAENLLKDTYIFQEITKLQNNLRYSTDGELISFDEYFNWLSNETQKLPRLKLESALGPGTEGKYLSMLVTSLEAVLDAADMLLTKNLGFQSKLGSALTQTKNLQQSFVAWYTLAATDYFRDQKVFKLSPAAIKALAEGEYSRLMKGIEVEIETLLEAVKVQAEQLKRHKKVSNEKYTLGKDQANALWTSSIPYSDGGIMERGSGRDFVAEADVLEEEEPDVPEFISRKPQVTREEGIKQMAQAAVDADKQVPVEEETETYESSDFCNELLNTSVVPTRPPELRSESPFSRIKDPVPNGKLCSICGKPQFTTPSGDTCMSEEGHGGVKGIEDAGAPVVEIHKGDNIRGTFYKVGTPAKVTPVAEVEIIHTLVHKEDDVVRGHFVEETPTMVPVELSKAHIRVVRSPEHGDKIKCGKCGLRIRNGQEMVGVLGDWKSFSHYEAIDCGTKEKREVTRNEGVLDQIADVAHEVSRQAVVPAMAVEADDLEALLNEKPAEAVPSRKRANLIFMDDDEEMENGNKEESN